MELEELYNNVKEWISTQIYVDMTTIQKEFKVGFSRAYKIIQFLIQDHLIEEKYISGKGHKVMRLDYPKA